MSRVAYVDGQYLPHRSATVHIENRGYQFADGVYEVVAVVGGSLLDEGPHLMRLARSLAELQIPAPMSNAALRIVMRDVIRRNDRARRHRLMFRSRGVPPRATMPSRGPRVPCLWLPRVGRSLLIRTLSNAASP